MSSPDRNVAASVPFAVPESRPRLLRVASDLVSLTKPKIILLLLISTLCPMILAGGGVVSPALALWTMIGGALLSGSASALNCLWDRDIDRLMKRTEDRPLAAGRLDASAALAVSAVLGVVGFWVLWRFANPAAAAIGLFGHLFYVLVYTMWLKRRTVQNIVIGGAAGAVPPLVGWVAVTGRLDLSALLLFLVIFLWTPPHFWALALNKNEDYRRANVPMLPVVAGDTETHRQMLIYGVLLLPMPFLLVYSDPSLGVFSLVMLSLLSGIFLWRIVQLCYAPVEEREQRAWSVFGFSLLYLALFFASLVVDSTWI